MKAEEAVKQEDDKAMNRKQTGERDERPVAADRSALRRLADWLVRVGEGLLPD
ncbi:MAG: hypothetical protein BIFFINMI_01705 [Phycisphaerae bacterium]|nr:hypothetical protein [Phycisphaerae bacterium]